MPASIVCDEFLIPDRSDFQEDMESKDIYHQLHSYIGFGTFLEDYDLYECDVSIFIYKYEDLHFNLTHRIEDHKSEKWQGNQIVRIKIVHENYNDGLSFVCHMSKQQYLDLYYFTWGKYQPKLDSKRYWSDLCEIATNSSVEEVLSDITEERFNGAVFFDVDKQGYPSLDIVCTFDEDKNKIHVKFAQNAPEQSTIIAPFIHLQINHLNYDDEYQFSYLVSRENFLALFY